jgi:uncharacterized protein YqhQ
MAEITKPVYGGQAVIEGVMMRGGASVAIGMRLPDQTIKVHTEKLGGIYLSKWAKVPFVRGIVMLWDALGLGIRALTISANAQGEEEEELTGWALYLTLAVSLSFSIALFFLIPATISHWVGNITNVTNTWTTNLFEGIIRILILITYMWSIGRMDDIKRVFGYHGAEHKTINAYESGAELTPEVVITYPIEHPRCGTAFLLTVMLFSVLIFTLIGPVPSLLIKLGLRVLLIPVVASISYEYIRWTAKHLDSPFVQFLIKPNLALQKMTTEPPTLAMIEVSIASFEAMLALENENKI